MPAAKVAATLRFHVECYAGGAKQDDDNLLKNKKSESEITGIERIVLSPSFVCTTQAHRRLNRKNKKKEAMFVDYSRLTHVDVMAF